MFLNRQVFENVSPPFNSVPSGMLISLTNSAQLQLRSVGVILGVGTVVSGMGVTVDVEVAEGSGVYPAV